MASGQTKYSRILTIAFALAALPAGAAPGPTIVYVGDSLTTGFLGAHPYTHYINLTPWHGKAWSSFNIGVSGKTLIEIAADANRTLNPLRGPGLNVAVVWAGTNDLAGHHGTPQQIFSVLRQFSQNERRLGFKIFVMTMISRVEDDPDKNPYNAMIRAYWTEFADGLIDIAANPALGANGAYRNPEFFQDGIHLTDKGYALVGSLVQAAINRSASVFETTPKPDRQPYAQRPIAR